MISKSLVKKMTYRGTEAAGVMTGAALGSALVDKFGAKEHAFDQAHGIKFDVPLDLATGLVLQTVGIMGYAGKYTDHVHHAANGALAAWAARMTPTALAKLLPAK